MNTQKQITLMVALVFLLLGGCAAYTVYDQNRENSAAAYQQEVHAERGARIFAQYCRQCHGNAGEGRIGPALNRPDLQNPDTREQTVQWVTDTIMCGRIGKIMPPWAISEGGSLTDEQISDVVTLITTNAGNAWQKAGEFSAEQNQIAPVPSIPDVLAAAVVTGSTGTRVCGQLAATAGPTQVATPPPAQTSWTVNATDNKFDLTTMAIPAGVPVTVTLNNKGQAIHNWELIDSSGKVVNDASGKPISMPLTSPGTSNSITFTLSTPGQYTFRCQVHPTEMIGDFFVVGATGSAGGASGSPTPTP